VRKSIVNTIFKIAISIFSDKNTKYEHQFNELSQLAFTCQLLLHKKGEQKQILLFFSSSLGRKARGYLKPSSPSPLGRRGEKQIFLFPSPSGRGARGEGLPLLR
jgi:hypothetical protein